MSTPLLQLNHYFWDPPAAPAPRAHLRADPHLGAAGPQAAVVAGAAPSFDKESWLLIPAGHRLTFVNQPEQGTFRSQALTLLAPPPAEWLAESTLDLLKPPAIRVTSALAFCFDLVTTMAQRQLCRDGPDPAAAKGFMASSGKRGALACSFLPPP